MSWRGVVDWRRLWMIAHLRGGAVDYVRIDHSFNGASAPWWWGDVVAAGVVLEYVELGVRVSRALELEEATI